MTREADRGIVLEFASTSTEREVLDDWLRRSHPDREHVSVLAGDRPGLAVFFFQCLHFAQGRSGEASPIPAVWFR